MTNVQNLINFLSVNTIEDEFNIYDTTNFLGSDNTLPIFDKEEDVFNVIDSVIRSVDSEEAWHVIEFIIQYENRTFGFYYSVTPTECNFMKYVEYEYYVPSTYKVK